MNTHRRGFGDNRGKWSRARAIFLDSCLKKSALKPRLEIWPEGSRASRRARAFTTLLVLAHCSINGLAALLTFPGTNSMYGIGQVHALAAYSIVHDGALRNRSGAFGSWEQSSEISRRGYVSLEEVRGPLLKSQLAGIAYVYPPGYPLYLAGTFIASGRLDYALAQKIQAFAAILGVPILILLTGMALGRPAVAYAAAAWYGLFAYPVELSQYPLPDALMLPLGACLLAASAFAASRKGLGGYVLAGVALGIGANFRTDFLGVAPFVALGILRVRGKFDAAALMRVGCVALAAFLILVPYGVIQARATGQFRLSTPALGTSLWEALGETPNPCGAILSDFETDQLLKGAGLVRWTPEGERFLLRRWRDCAAREPRWFLGSVLSRQYRVLDLWIRSARPAHGETFAGWRRRLEEGIRVTPSQYQRETGKGKASWALHYPGDFGRAVLCRLVDIGSPGLVAALVVCVLAVLLFDSYGLLLGAIPLAYFAFFSLLHVEQRYLAAALAPLAYLGCQGISTIYGLLQHKVLRHAPQAV